MIKKITLSLTALTLVFSCLILLLPVPGDIPVLMYHFAGSEESAAQSGNVITRKSFEKQMKYLKWFRYRVISMDEYVEIMRQRKPPRGREVVLTFDDGNETYATDFFPVLENYKYPSTVFLVSESVKNRTNGSMSQETIRRVMQSPLVTLASHTKTHPFLTEVNETKLREEVEQSKKDLETIFSRPFHYFSYPFGALDKKAIQAVEDAGYRIAFTTSVKKLKTLQEGLFSRTRVKMDESCENLILFLAKSSGIYQNFKRLRHHLKQSSSLK